MRRYCPKKQEQHSSVGGLGIDGLVKWVDILRNGKSGDLIVCIGLRTGALVESSLVFMVAKVGMFLQRIFGLFMLRV
ncbi:hypothetical protein CBR_g31558 [Chara braunii]|uniref:Uncharacterized protein n=1 Tax=Chara braunii TaxID=69332 RepID=A0A388LFN4_CHABU|nr:hypothetical protein CBR_g31558 [Chara braunii]|eukprot:GBG81002.1 hypothetical protein CBR_g31558 [Chara braunii]